MASRSTVAVLALLVAACGGAPRPAPAPAPAEAVTQPSANRFDARLSGYVYPHEVHVRRFEAQRQPLEMAYMDVRPANANGRAVLLLHGKNFSGAYWASTIDALVAEGYRVVVPDQIGFGKSSKPESFQYSFQALATFTRDLLDELEVDAVSVVGHSMGGMLAVRFALMFPERVEKLALVNPIGLEDWKRVVPYQGVEAWYRSELGKTAQGVRDYMRESYFGGEWKAGYEPIAELQVGWIEGPQYPQVAWSSALTYDMIFTQPVVYELPAIAAPTLLVIGQRDRTALGKNLVAPEVAATLGDYPALGRRTAEAIPNATLVELEGIGHVPQYEAFDAYMAALRDFLAAPPPGAP